MAVIRCKMCGGDLILTEGSSVAQCDSCGRMQTVPKADDEKKLASFARANRLRASCEFDKAAGVYETIVADFPEEAEAYWGLVLCKYGIEYVDDPATGKKIPTCHRSSYDSVLDDNNFEQALENSDIVAQKVYREEAKQFERIRKGILEVSSNEQPYDIFICYKETDLNGDRTLDSVLAQDLYSALTEKGYRVFFSRITLQGKLGEAYEPYIFAALNSAKVMLAVGTCYEHYNAVWVKNEWSRFLKLMAADKSKHLIPCYKGIDAYDMPEEFARLQAQDLGKMGATQDILRGVEKLLPKQEPVTVVQKEVIVSNNSDRKITTLLDRGNMALADEEWDKADGFFEEVLNENPKCAEAYLGKFLARAKQQNLNSWKVKRFEFFKLVNGNSLGDERTACEEDHARKNAAIKKYVSPGGLTEAQITEIYAYKRTYKNRADRVTKNMEEWISDIKSDKLLLRAQEFASAELAKEIENALKAVFNDVAAYVEERRKMDQNDIEEVKAFYAAHLDQADKQAEQLYAEAMREKAEIEGKNNRLRSMREKISAVQSLIATTSGHSAGVRSDGTVVSVGYRCDVSDWEDITAVAAGRDYIVGLKADGSLVTRYKGEKKYYEGECDVSEWRNIVAIAANWQHTVGLRSDGTVVAVGDRGCDTSEWSDIVAVAAGNNNTVGLKSDGTVVATDCLFDWHEVHAWKDIVAVAAGYDYTVGLKSDGTVLVTKYEGTKDYNSQCGVHDWVDIVAIAAGWSHIVGLKCDGTVVAAQYTGDKDDNVGQCDTAGWTDIVAIAASGDQTLGLKSDGTVLATGRNQNGQCNVSGWKLFGSIDTIQQEREQAKIESQKRQQYRAAGLCQHCGGELKGFLGKKCVCCGKPKDY